MQIKISGAVVMNAWIVRSRTAAAKLIWAQLCQQRAGKHKYVTVTGLDNYLGNMALRWAA
jgi:hypothetical protein